MRASKIMNDLNILRLVVLKSVDLSIIIEFNASYAFFHAYTPLLGEVDVLKESWVLFNL